RVGGEVVVPLLGAEPLAGVGDVLDVGPGCLYVIPIGSGLRHEVVVTDLLWDGCLVCLLRVALRDLLLPDAPPVGEVLLRGLIHARPVRDEQDISIPIPIPLRHTSGTRRSVYIRASIRTREGAYTVRAGEELLGCRLALRGGVLGYCAAELIGRHVAQLVGEGVSRRVGDALCRGWLLPCPGCAHCGTHQHLAGVVVGDHEAASCQFVYGGGDALRCEPSCEARELLRGVAEDPGEARRWV